MLGLANF